MLSSLLSAIAAPPADAFAEAQRHLDSLTKPPGSLGRLEEIAARLAVLRDGTPCVERPVIFTFAADHGVVAEGVSAYPRSEEHTSELQSRQYLVFRLLLEKKKK